MRKSITGLAGVVVCALLGLAGLARGGTVTPAGFGAIGDSFADEYQFEPDRKGARNFVEILAATRGLNFGALSQVSLGSPRLQGFENDWALSGATSDDLPPQTAGLAQQIASGKVGTAFVFIGGNDFINAVQAPNPGAVLPTLPQHVLTNTLTAIGTLLAANPNAHIVISNLFDVSQLPLTQQAIAAGLLTPAEAVQLGQLITGYNSALAAQLAGNPQVAIVDLNTQAKGLVSQPTFQIGGQTIDAFTPGNDFHHLFLADGLHTGTVGQALLANGYIAALDSQFGAGITPLSESEIINFAQSVQAAAIPLPAAWMSGGSALILLMAWSAVRRAKSRAQ